MNLILLQQEDLLDGCRAKITDARQRKHIIEIHKATLGDKLTLGLVNGNLGSGVITDMNCDAILLDIQLDQAPRVALNTKLILALPRPKMLRRLLQTIATLGIKELHLINAYRVEKSYWQTPFLQQKVINEQLILGLEQGVDTLMPNVYLHKLFKPFVQDQLPQIIQNTQALVAHPYANQPCPSQLQEPLSLAVGPEGGFIDYEIDLLQTCGLTAISLGSRIMRVETVVPYLLGRLSFYS
jgi:16S rRNA (uracil1498-N3)-methyltransferase